MITILHGTVEHGDARGRELGFPTANLPITGRPELDGVWAGYASVEGMGRFAATISIGRRSTYYPEDALRLVEVHILDFDGDIYGTDLRVELVSFIRGQQRCNGEAELVARIGADVRATRELVDWSEHYLRLPWLGLVPA